MTKAEANLLKANLDSALVYIYGVIKQQIRALKIDVDSLTKEE